MGTVNQILRGFCAVLLSCVSLISTANPVEHGITEKKSIVWATPKGFPLTADIYVPETKTKKHPVLIIYHGGGWLINSNAIMNSMSEYIAKHSDIIVVNMNYRLLVDNNNSTTMDEIVDDVFGGVLWVKDHISEFGGNPNSIAVTGDSAGGHLASMILTRGRDLSDGNFSNDLKFTPSYLPAGKTATQIANENGLRVQAAVISYGAFNIYETAQHGFETDSNFFWQLGKSKPRGIFGSAYNYEKNPEMYKAVSPIYNIPKRSSYKLPPQFIHVGTIDTTTPPSSAKAYVKALKEAGQTVKYKEYPGLNHAYLDNGCNEFLKMCFDRNAITPLNDIINFLNKNLK